MKKAKSSVMSNRELLMDAEYVFRKITVTERWLMVA